jgi:anti-repressor protein
MSNLQIFTYSDKQVRTILKDGNPWWVLKDVCDILELSNNRMVADRLEEDEVSQTYVTDNLGRQQETTIINESGLYNVILRSDKPEAKAFKRWITHEVLPAIRKTGGYSMVPKSFAEALRLAADLEEERQKLLPKAQGYDYLMNAEGTVTIGEAAKLLDIPGFGPQKIFKLLIVEEIIFKRGDSYLPYQQYRSHFIVKQNPVQRGDFIKERTQLYLDMAGLDWLAKLLVKRGYEVNYTHQRALAKV